MGESFPYFDGFPLFWQWFDNSSWDSCKFDEIILGGEVHIFDKEMKFLRGSW